jgi:hypothetical protein
MALPEAHQTEKSINTAETGPKAKLDKLLSYRCQLERDQ